MVLRENIKIFLKIYNKNYLKMVLILILMILNSSLIYFSTKILAEIYDVSKGRNLNKLLFFCSILFLTWIIIKLIDVINDFYIRIISEKICLKLIFEVMEKIVYSKYSWILRKEKGEILQILVDDINQFKYLNVGIIPKFLYTVIICIASCIYLYQLHPLLLFVAIMIYPLCILPVVFLADLQQRRIIELRKLNETLKSFLFQIFDSIKDIKIFNKENDFIKIYYENQTEWSKKIFQNHYLNSVTKNIPRIVIALVPMMVYIIGGYFYFKNKISIGRLLSSITIISNIYSPIKFFSSFYAGIKSLSSISKKLYEFLDAPMEEKYNLSHIKKLEFKKIEFINVGYFNDREIVLDNLSFKIEKGEKILLLGETGSGKTTLINLITGLIEPCNGKIILNDSINLNCLNCLDWHAILGVVQQKPNLYSNSIHENLNYFKENNILNLSEFLERMHLSEIFKRNDNIGEAVQSISAGQAQRLSIARTLLCSKDIFIFDEPTGNQDSKIEKDILKYIFCELCKKNTIIFSSHKLNSIKYSTKILFLKNKRISGFDTHEKLLKNNRDYFEFVFSRKDKK